MKECPLCKALENEKDKFLYEDDDIVILPTKNLKGHKKRIMVVSKEHISYSGMSLERVSNGMFLNRFISFCKSYFDEPTFALPEPTYCTIPQHWHYIACDWNTSDHKELQQLHYTPHRAISTNVKWRP